MTKQKIQALLLAILPFGTGVSFFRCFVKNNENIGAAVVLIAGFLFVLSVGFFPKTRKNVLETVVKLQPPAAVVFTATFVLSFLPYSMRWPQLFSVLVLNTVCLCMMFEKQPLFTRRGFFGLLCGGALIGTGIAFSGHTGLIYIGFVVLSLLCRPKEGGKTAHELWKDIAFPLFVLIGSFLLFIAANHGGSVSPVITQSIVMLMTGGLLMMPSSSLRLALMTLVLMIFGSYVFSTQNAESVFNRKPPVQMERLF